MMLKPNHHLLRKPQITDLSQAKKKPLSLVKDYSNHDWDSVENFSDKEKANVIKKLEEQIGVIDIDDFVGPKLQRCVSADDTGDAKLLFIWLASYNPIPKNVCWLHEKEICIARNLASLKKREEDGSEHSNLLDNVWVAINPTRGWWLERPPTLDQLFSTSKRAAERIATAANDETYHYHQKWWTDRTPLNRGDLFDLKYIQDCAQEKRRLDKWMWQRSNHNPNGHLTLKGLKKFFRDTGVPKNNDLNYHMYWGAQDSENDDSKLQSWLLSHQLLNGHFMPDKLYEKPCSLFKRKVNAYMIAISRIEPNNQASIDRVHAVYKQLFVAKTTNYFLNSNINKIYPIIAIGEPYDDYDIEEKKELIRESNKKHSEENKLNGKKVWPDLGLLNRCKKRSEEDKELSLRITNRIFSEENIRSLIREEMNTLRGEIRKEMQGFTEALVDEFEIAMEDCVEQVVDNAVSTISMAKNPKDITPSFRNKEYKSNKTGIFLPT